MWKRCITTSSIALGSPSKSGLAKLRKSTGYSFTKCKEALEKHENDVPTAEKWLRKQAQAHGWEKATKLQGRITTQGLISVAVSPNAVTMAEINCETDFVSRNSKFRTLASHISNECLRYFNTLPLPSTFARIELTGEDVGQLVTPSGRKVIDDIVIQIGDLGENLGIRRAVCIHASLPTLLSGFTHPTDNNLLGKYGALVAFNSSTAPFPNNLTTEEIGRRLCQHVIGMNPSSIGDDDTVPAEDVEEETAMIYQEFLLEPDLLVKDFLQQSGVTLMHYERLECGENIGVVQNEKDAWEIYV